MTDTEMAENRLPEARVWCAGGTTNDGGWYYRIDHETPVGPFDTALEAGSAARQEITIRAESAA